MTGRAIPTAEQLDHVFAGPNAFSACPEPDQAALRAILDRRRVDLAVYELNTAGLAFATGQPPAGNLYCVLKGCISLQWQSPSGRNLSLRRYYEGHVLGELECELCGAPSVDLGLQLVPVISRFCRASRIVVFPKEVVSELLRNTNFRDHLVRTAIDRSRRSLTLMSSMLLCEPALTIAHLCLSPSCGAKVRLHPALTYLDGRAAIEKTITFSELRHLTSLSINTVRDAIGLLEELGYIRTVRDHVNATRLVILKPEALLQALRDGTLTTAA